jgi:hypothetical protein
MNLAYSSWRISTFAGIIDAGAYQVEVRANRD